ncbi:unnamed protein product [Strongylus vulgaris]|uniref:Uncharacterized protein n=1 Tax=Strongylus vulgaris TaxID=40348 RepID=A0A3P7JM77_STRVU|nr:unnamed protein product [Strongylus vulgaris]
MPLGYFRILRGNNECSIEELVFAGQMNYYLALGEAMY